MKLIQTLTEQIVNILIIFENKREKIEHDKENVENKRTMSI